MIDRVNPKIEKMPKTEKEKVKTSVGKLMLEKQY
jgi:hypothetical protein